jgi:crotonobetainyl-CoA:carnitine CoA-transferase CaiB-like acyl-CoA transferase
MGPLEGIKVVDASSFLTGPLAAMMMADMGADVVKVEPAPRGDTYRRFGTRHNGHGIAFANANRNKRSVMVDLRDAAGLREFDRLLDDADVLFTNWRPATTRALGFDDTVIDRHPRLIWIRITGFGSDGPMADVPAFDSVLQARTGLAAMQGGEGRPTLIKSWMCDKVTALFSTQAALAALLTRAGNGAGGIVEVPMLDSVAYFNFPDLMVERTVLERSHLPAANGQLAANRPLPTSDGWLLTSPVSGRQLVGALAALGCEERKDELMAIRDPTALTLAFYDIAEEVMPHRPTADWLDAFRKHDVPAAEVFDFDQHLVDPQVEHNCTYVEFDDPRLGRIRHPRHPATFPSGRGGPTLPSPDLDEHRADLVRD